MTGVATDTRTLQAGELFVALRGPRFDGHTFVEQACARHAAAALVSEQVADKLAQVRVPDTLKALGDLGAYWRARFELPVTAVTGSNGKTTVKEMLGSILGPSALINAGNLNNEIGLPLTLCRIRAGHAFVVVEMGMNHLGEIERMSRMARPDIAIITNAAAAHLEGVGTLRGVARAKSEIFAGMPESGVAILNADDPFFALWRERARPRRCVTFGMTSARDVWADVERAFPGARFTLHTPAGSVAVTLPLPGIHNVYNALAAAGAARELDVDLEHIRAGLERVSPVPGRLVGRRATCGAQVFDDTYNANPASLHMALDTLAAAPAPRILVLGDMGELGEAAQRLHSQVGVQAREAGVSRLFAIGPLTRYAVEAFGPQARHFEQPGDLIDALNKEMGPETTVLIKGSRFMHMEDIVAAIVAHGDPAESGDTH
ncbi:MAG: UDP-N-acetylmuramoyl-tripeptide--D-alanyl-D-alanine ligase [Gammaproteobacteria bacterium]|nr:UDP-N-acetylmuramoyl-tripeptide--D-alanyl-D-alanine ligase [Gammaproteobacteria bacterium]